MTADPSSRCLDDAYRSSPLSGSPGSSSSDDRRGDIGQAVPGHHLSRPIFFTLPKRPIGRPNVCLFGLQQPHVNQRYFAARAVIAYRTAIDVIAVALHASLHGGALFELLAPHRVQHLDEEP